MTTLVNADTGTETALPDGAGMLLFDDCRRLGIRQINFIDHLSNQVLNPTFRVIGLLVVKEEKETTDA